jgi:eukaryotic-like serine/threonine-protein kinase
MPSPPSPTVLAGKFRLVRKLGEGGMGTVWQADHLVLNSKVAIKVLGPEVAQDSEALARFLREAQSAASLRSPHVVQILDHGVDQGQPYIAMELLEGESLAERLIRDGTLSPVETSRIITHMARALSRAHEAGIVHRDLKPDNVFLVRNDEEHLAKLLDFGIAKATGKLTSGIGRATRTGTVMGSPYYMSPEQAEGLKTLDHRTDIWSLGVIAFECLLGHRPFDGESVGGLVLAICTRPMPVPSKFGKVPSGFDRWFAKVCARDLKHRYGSAKQAAADLRELCDGKFERTDYRPRAESLTGDVNGEDNTLLASATYFDTGERKRRSSRYWVFGAVGACVFAVGAVALLRLGETTEPAVTASATRPLLAAAAPSVPAAPAEAVPAPVATETPPPAASAAPNKPSRPAAKAPRRAAPRSSPKTATPKNPKVNLGI